MFRFYTCPLAEQLTVVVALDGGVVVVLALRRGAGEVAPPPGARAQQQRVLHAAAVHRRQQVSLRTQAVLRVPVGGNETQQPHRFDTEVRKLQQTSCS